MSSRPIKSRLSCLAMSILLAGSCCVPAAFAVEAGGGASVYQKLGEYENTLFGKTENSTPIEKRLQNIEKQLFGKASKGGSTAERIAAVEKVMSGNSKYLPPIAPSMDRSDFAPEPKKAPDNPELQTASEGRGLSAGKAASMGGGDEKEAPLPADASDRTKGLLRQAMQSYSQGKIADAERLYRQVLAIDFRNSDANYNLGAIAETKNDLNSAKRYYTAALKANPGDYDIQDALKAVQQKIQSQPAQPVASSGGAGPGDEIAGGPATAGDKAIASEAADSYKKGNFDDAIQKLGYLAHKNPYDANTQFALGQAFRGKGDIANATRHLRSAATLDTKNDLYIKALNEIQSQGGDDQSPQTASAQGDTFARQDGGGRHGSGPSNQDVQPFVGLPSSNDNSGGSDMAAVDNYMRQNGGGNGGGVMIGSVSGYGNQGMMGGGGMGFPMMLGTGSGGTRLSRMMTSSLGGAAMGAMMSRGQPGGMSKGAMRGAMYGGLFGLMTGGF